MNSEKWRKQGYRTLFRGDDVLLVKSPKHVLPSLGTAIFITEVERGQWMEFDDLTDAPWRKTTIGGLPTVPQGDDVQLTVLACYCDEAVLTCDFCAGRRRPPTQDEIERERGVRR